MAKLLKGFEAPTPRRLLSEGEVKEPPKELPPPPKPPEYFPGYQKQVSTFSGMAETATKRLESAQKQMTELQSQWGLRMFWDVPARGTLSFPILPFVQMQFTSEEEFNRQRQIAQAELDSATREYSRMSWRTAVLASMPYLLADTEGSVRTLDDILTEMPNDFLLEGDRQWLQETYDKLSHLVPTELPEGFVGDSLQAREQLLNTVLAEPKAEFKAVHNMTVDELMRSVQPITAELPTGMSNDDVRSLLTDLEFDEETQADILSIHNVAQELATEWKIQSAHINLVRQGLLEAEAPDLTPMEFTKMLFTQPALATLELLDKYFNMLPRPLAAKAIIDFPRIRKDSDAAQLEELYKNYRAEGVGYWEAYSKAFQDWGENTWLKMYIETAFDPTSYIGLGIATKVAKPIPYLGRFVGAVERGWCELWDVPFRGLRNMIKAIPKTPTQHALSYARQAFMDTRAYLSRYTGRDLTSITAPEVKEAMENAIQQAMERPYETGDLSVRVGKYLTDYDFIEEAATREWVNLAGGEGAQVTGQMVHDTNMQFDLFFRKSLTAPEAASNILASVGVEATEKNIGKMAKALQRHSEKILGTSLDVVKGDSARDILSGLLRNVEDMQVRKAMSPVYQYALKTGRVTSWLGRAVDSVTRNGILAKIDRMVTAPMANQYLLFTNYGPFNILENAMRSFLGGGELLYPRAASPVDELVRVGEGLVSLPYEFVTFQREMGRLEIAVIDPKTNKTMVFSKGKIPGMTKELPFGLKINIGGKDYPIRSWQNWNDMFGDIGTKQRAHYLLTKYKQFLAELAPDQIDQIAEVFGKHQGELDAIESIGKGDRADLVRVLEQDATVGPDMIRKHDIPLPELERRRALRQINKTLDKTTDIYSPHKQTIRDGVLDGTIWKDIDGSMDAVAQSIREFNVATLQAETAALDRLVADLTKFAPADGDELLRTMGFVSDIVDGITERISEVRSITRSRAAKLLPGEKDNFYRASTDTLAEFLGKSNEAVEQMLDGVKANLTRPRTLLDDLTRSMSFGEPTMLGIKEAGYQRVPVVLDGEDVGSLLYRLHPDAKELVVDELKITKAGVLDRGLMSDLDILIHNLASESNLDKVVVIAKDSHKLLYQRGGYVNPVGTSWYEKSVMKPKPAVKLTEQQTSRLGALSDAIKLRHAGAISARDLDRRIINDAISATPRKQRTAEWWDWLENKRSTEAWEPYWAREEDLFNQVEDLKLGMMQDLGVDITDVPTPPQVDQLTPAHVAYLMGTTGDDLNKALTRVGAMVTVRPKNRFVTWVYRRANKAATKVNKTAEEIGFSREAIGDVYDQMFTQAGIDPKFVANEPLTPTMLQMEELRQELHRIKGLKAMPESDYVKFKGYLNGVADDLEGLTMYTPDSGWVDMREEAMMKARTQYELDFTDYDNRNMVDAAMRMTYPFWTYEWQRWFWLPRAMLRTPGVGTGIGRYQNYSDSGYIPMPGTDIQFNPLRGTVFMGGFRRLMLRDYPEYYDAFPGMEAIDYISRMGFYPGIHVMLPIIMTGAATGKPEWGEVLPAWAKTGLNAARAVSPELAGKAIDQVFPDRFRDYLTMLTLGEEGYDADEIWRKKKSGKPLSEDEQKLWLKAEAKATGLKGILFEQSGVFRIRPPEYTEFMESTSGIIEDMIGVPESVQETIRNRYPVTGKRLSDYYKLDTLQQKVLYEREQYRRWQGVTEPLYPSTWQQEDVRVKNYFEGVEKIYDDYRNLGVFDEQGNMLSPSVNELTNQWLSGTIGPDQWRSGRASLLEQASAAVRELGLREYPDVPKTLDERTARLEERGIPAPTLSPDQELMYMYFDLKPEMKYNWESGKDELDYDTYFSKIDVLIDTLEGEFKQRLLDRIQYSWNSVEKLYWDVSREYLRPYRLVRSLVLEQYTPEQRQQILRFEVARGAEREELKEVIGPGGTKLISGFSQGVREARLRLRYLDPTLDSWCYFFGITDTLITKQAEVEYENLSKRYLIPSMAK